MPSQQDILPQRSLSENPKIDSLFLPTARPYPLNPLTCGPPPMYWLGASRWCLGPLCMLHSVWICFFLAFTPFLLPLCLFDFVVRSGWCLSLVAWRMCGFLGLCSLPFISSLDWVLLGWRPLPFCQAHALFFPVFVGLLAMDLAIPLHRAYYSITSLFISCYPWAHGLMLLSCQLTFHIFTSFGLYWPTFLLCQPISFTRLPRSIYFFFTSFTPMGFLLDPLGFLGPITTSLPLITFRAYWLLSQPNEFTNSFPRLP